MIPEEIKKEFKLGLALFGLLVLVSYLLILGQGPFFDSVQARIYFVLMITSMAVFGSLLENYLSWNEKSPEKLKERFKQITFLFGVPFIFLVLTDWGYTFFLILVMGIPLGLSLVEGIPVFHYVKITKKKILFTALIFVLLYFIANTYYSINFFDKETFYVLLISHMISSIISNFLFGLKFIKNL